MGVSTLKRGLSFNPAVHKFCQRLRGRKTRAFVRPAGSRKNGCPHLSINRDFRPERDFLLQRFRKHFITRS
jgi:hypothetical protein